MPLRKFSSKGGEWGSAPTKIPSPSSKLKPQRKQLQKKMWLKNREGRKPSASRNQETGGSHFPSRAFRLKIHPSAKTTRGAGNPRLSLICPRGRPALRRGAAEILGESPRRPPLPPRWRPGNSLRLSCSLVRSWGASGCVGALAQPAVGTEQRGWCGASSASSVLNEADRPMSMTAATCCTGDAVTWALQCTDCNNPVSVVASFRSTKGLSPLYVLTSL
jgi:hypothetical protein